MFGIDFPEVLIIFGLALVVLGPKKLPGVAAQVGRWLGRARSMARQFREQLEQEVNSVESALDTNQRPKPGVHATGPGPAARPGTADSTTVSTEDRAAMGPSNGAGDSSSGAPADAAAAEAIHTAHGWDVPGPNEVTPPGRLAPHTTQQDPDAHRDQSSAGSDSAPASATRD
ncbi:MAG TPA: twin-arginine translocase TatA/TatE family subunit [Steroidobacteraceae bacterium]|nr:twin-arginine translocase TatA/TatE family subunit [Steroidobacteraceae bacterium]